MRLLAVALSLPAYAATGHDAKPGAVAVELIADSLAIAPGRPFRLGLRMRHDPGWHTYWINPGDAGLPTSLDWRLPAGFAAGDIEWPAPQRLQRGPLASYGYEGELVLPVPAFPPRTATGDTAAVFAVTARWLECRENCVPQEARLALSMPAPATAGRQWRALFRAAQQRRPQPATGARAQARMLGEDIEVLLHLPAEIGRQGDLFFEAEDVVEPGPVPTLRAVADTVVWRSRLTANGRRLANRRLAAVWVAPSAGGAPRAWRIEVTLP